MPFLRRENARVLRGTSDRFFLTDQTKRRIFPMKKIIVFLLPHC